MLERRTEGRSRNHCCHGKALRITYSECVYVGLFIQHAYRMHRIILTSGACRFYHIFICYLIIDRILGGKNTEDKMRY